MILNSFLSQEHVRGSYSLVTVVLHALCLQEAPASWHTQGVITGKSRRWLLFTFNFVRYIHGP
jgi:hypothetical protein